MSESEVHLVPLRKPLHRTIVRNARPVQFASLIDTLLHWHFQPMPVCVGERVSGNNGAQRNCAGQASARRAPIMIFARGDLHDADAIHFSRESLQAWYSDIA
jgi:hypothetical protein